MKAATRNLVFTEDGSHTIVIQDMGVSYHSLHGAIQETRHVFVNAGLHAAQKAFPGELLSILEVGFGTGLNAFMTAIEATVNKQPIRYTAVEAYPLDLGAATVLNYPEQLDHESLFHGLHLAPWDTMAHINPEFTLQKMAVDIRKFKSRVKFHLVYFDAFAPEAQPELWTEEVFRHIGEMMHEGGLLVTYCSKGAVRRAMEAAGWQIKKLRGPAKKREMVRATKL